MKTKWFLMALIYMGFSQTTLAQANKANDLSPTAYGFGINPIVNLRSVSIIDKSRANRIELGAIITTAINRGHSYLSFGLGYVLNRYHGQFNDNHNFSTEHNFVGQFEAFERFIKMNIVKDLRLDVGLGVTGVFQVGKERTRSLTSGVSIESTNSITLAPAIRTELVITKYLSLHTRLGLGVSATARNFHKVPRVYVWLQPLQKQNLLGQTGVTFYL